MAEPARRVGDMSWFAWGSPEHAVTLSPRIRDLLSQTLGVTLADTPPAVAAGPRLPEPALPAEAVRALAAVVGGENVRTDGATRLRHAGGKSIDDLIRRRQGDVADAPDAVVLPGDHDEVARVLAVCAHHRVAVVPFGGGTSVVGGVEPLAGRFPAVIALDLRRLDRLVEFDAESRTATLQAGLRTPEAAELLAARGCTLGHLPQSYEYATIGGYAATRSSGQASAGYGRFDSMVVALRAAAPSGTLELGRAPATAAGPDLRQLLLGSEGTFGVITEVTVRVHDLPETEREEAWSFPDHPSGVAALRELARSAARPTTARLSDETETFVNAALSGREATPGCSLILGYAGTESDVAQRRAAAHEPLTAAGGGYLGSGPVAEWRDSRFRGPYLRDALLAAGVLSETLETATSWSGILGLYEAVRAAVTATLDTPERRSVVMCHISHIYPDGASLYFTVVTAAGSDPRARWAAAKHAACEAIVSHGGTISHHHAVGTDHRPWLAAEVGEPGVSVLRAVKASLDPAGILNPGKLIP